MSTFFPNISCESWPGGLTISLCHLSAKCLLSPQHHVRRTSKDSREQLVFESGKSSFQINREPHALSLALSSLFKGFCCLAFISGAHSCRKRMKRCVFEQIECFWENASALPCEFMGKFHSSSEEDRPNKNKKKRENSMCLYN